MKFKQTWIVLGIVVLLGGWVYWHEVLGGRANTARNKEARRLLPVAAADITAIRIRHTGQSFDLEQRKGNWYLIQPVVAPCDPSVITAFLDTLVAAQREEDVGRGDLPRYGLDAPAATVQIDAAGATHTLRLGRINPQQTLVYLLVDDDQRVLLSTSSLLTMSLANDLGWRDRRMIIASPENVRRYRIRTPAWGQGTFELEPATGWRVAGPVRWRVDPSRGLALVRSVAPLRASGVAAENKSEARRFGVDNRKAGIEVYGASGELLGDVVFGLADGEGAYFAVVPDKPEIFKVDAKLVDAAFSLVTDARDRKALVPFDPAKVDVIRVESPEDKFELRRRSAQDWKVVASTRYDSTFAIASGSVDALLTDLATLEVAGFPDQQPPASLYDPPAISLHFLTAGREVAGLAVGQKDPHGMNAFARGTGEPAVFYLSPAALLKMPFDLDRLKAEGENAPEGGDKG